MKKIYLIGSLRNPLIPEVGVELRSLGYEVFDDWFSGGYEADDKWREYEQARGRTYRQALDGYIAEHIFGFDKVHLDAADMAILVAPAGKSGHLELGYIIGQGKPGFILLDDPDRWDIMYKFATDVFETREAMYETLPTAGDGEPW